jgi:predicted DCC family thiol-disulfide oxidoreductase YuxK
LVCSRISRRTIAPDKASTRTYSEVIMMRTHQLLNKISSKEADRQSMYISRSQTTLKASRVVVPNIRQILTAGLQLITVTTSTIKVPVRMVSPQNRLPCR